jgi:hypothetical protein
MPTNKKNAISLLDPSGIGVGVDLTIVVPEQQCVVIYDDSWPEEPATEIHLTREELISVTKALNKAIELLGLGDK